MRAENLTIPFPEKAVAQVGELEELLLGPALDYRHLPDTIQASGTEAYLEWLSKLASLDGQERGDLIYKLVGESPYLEFSPDPEVISDPNRYLVVDPNRVPVKEDLTHLHSSCFEPRELNRLINNCLYVAVNYAGEPRLSSALSSTTQNYLILATEQVSKLYTLNLTDLEAALGNLQVQFEDNQESYALWGPSIAYLVDEVNPGKKQEFIEKLGDIEDAYFPKGGLTTYVMSHLTTNYIAQKYELGFYISNKDGQYRKFNKDKVFDRAMDHAKDQERLFQDFGVANNPFVTHWREWREDMLNLAERLAQQQRLRNLGLVAPSHSRLHLP